ncbi:hypothetical protein [Duganella callida]|uniref:Uncharacterized protein n=1 Tax=Duganella callida TaxID=2561932 RepID=A0A4Y9SAF6_9BURK|nr:hypothetical protein [Duganella callida]TFW18859.1 hypothetical protein E4L98_17175 [Duganella callida]
MNLSKARTLMAYGLRKIADVFRAIVRPLPLIGGLADCSGKDHVQALKEFFFALAFSTTTFWVTVVIMSVLIDYQKASLLDMILKTVSNGELLIFSVSFAGPILLAAMQDRKGKSPFPGAIWHVYALWVFAVVAAVIFGLLRLQTIAPSLNLNVSLNMNAIRQWSYYIFGLALFLRYTAVVYQKMLASTDASGQKQDKAFADQWAAHAEGQQS